MNQSLSLTRKRVAGTILGLDGRLVRVQEKVRPYLPSASLLVAFVIMGLLIAAGTPTHATASINFDASSLDIFFTWFNTIFNVLLPIALIGAGIAAGAGFVWVVAGMLINAFSSMLGRRRMSA